MQCNVCKFQYLLLLLTLHTSSTKNKENVQWTVPGNSLQIEIVRGHKSFMVDTAMVKGLKVKNMNSNLKKDSVRVRPFPGETVKQLNHYVIPTLIDNALDTTIIQGGCNDVSKKRYCQSYWKSRKSLSK